mgnify:CR=1 FL=1
MVDRKYDAVLCDLLTGLLDSWTLWDAAAGGVVLIACQWANALGVKVIGTVGSAEKAELAKKNGAWATINYREENVVERVRELTGGAMVPVVYDSVGKDTWMTSPSTGTNGHLP